VSNKYLFLALLNTFQPRWEGIKRKTQMNNKFLKGLAASFALAASGFANAGLIFSESEVVTNVTNEATFDTLTSNNISLSSYNEDGINIFVNDYTYTNFDAFALGSNSTGFHYGSGGNYSWVEISLVSGGLINALDFLLGDGNDLNTTNFHFEAFQSGVSIGSGHTNIEKGVVGFLSDTGFDTLRVAANGYTSTELWGANQAIALDNLRIGSSVSVPEPSTLAVFTLGLMGLASRKFKKQS
jgi:hypothetical protein